MNKPTVQDIFLRFTLHTLKNIPLLQNRQRFPETS